MTSGSLLAIARHLPCRCAANVAGSPAAPICAVSTVSTLFRVAAANNASLPPRLQPERQLHGRLLGQSANDAHR